MSSFVCALDRSGAPVSREAVDASLEDLRGPGTIGHWFDQPYPWLAMGESLRRDTPSDPLAPKPHTLGQLTLAGDVRLDNREDLFAALPVRDPDSADAELVLHAYQAWGAECVGRLAGEFSFAIWDDRRQQVFAARDPMGERALFYAEAGSQLVLSNEIRLLRGWPQVLDKLDEVTLAGLVVRQGMFMRDVERTFYDAIKQVPPGHFVVVSQGAIRQHRYWLINDLEEQPTATGSREDLLEEFKEIFLDVVSKRMRSAKAVGAQLSGGLDSTTIACLAAAELQQSGQSLHCFSHLTREPIPDISQSRTVRDEAYIAAASDQYGNIVQHWAYGDERELLGDVVDQFYFTGIVHPNHFQTWWDEISRQAQELGVGTMLTGGSGNMTASWDGKGPSPSLAHRALRKLRRSLNQLRQARRPGQLDLLRPGLAKRVGLQDRMGKVDRQLNRQRRAGMLGRGFSGLFRAYPIGRFDIELRDPMGDFRLVEFCLRAPDDLFRRGDEKRLLIRDSMRGIVPDKVLDRTSRQLQAADWVERARARRPALIARFERLSRNDAVNQFLDLSPLRRLLEDQPVDRGNLLELTSWNDGVLHALAVATVLEWIGEGSPRPRTA